MNFIKKKVALAKRQQFISVLTDLLANGFSLQEALLVMEHTQRFSNELLTNFQATLLSGGKLSACFAAIDCTPQEIAQIQLAQEHGNLIQTLHNISEQIAIKIKQKRELQKVTTYPVILLLFLSSALISMRQFLLPQLLDTGMIDESHWGIRLIVQAPYYLAGCLVGLTIGFFFIRQYLKKASPIQKATFWARIPIFNEGYRLATAAHFSLEWGKLFCEGVEMRQIILFMQQTDKNSLLADVASELHEVMQRGDSLADKLASYSFFPGEFPLIIFRGEAKGNLGAELILYSQLTQKLLVQKIEKWMQWIQPIVFLFIALLIVSVYGAMFLPIYGNMGGVLE
ncbi:MAG: competence type IV pilus assembly protein ComGB [Enterococcus sp.]